MTQKLTKQQPALPFSQSALNRSVDAVSAFAMATGLLLWLFPLVSIPYRVGSCLAASAVSLALVLLFSLRWWIAPAAGVLAALAGGLVLFLSWWSGELSVSELLLFWMDQLSALPELLAQRASLGLGLSAFPIQLALAIPVSTLCWAFLRRFFSFLALLALTGSVTAFLWAGGYDTAETAALFFLFCLIVCLPRWFFRYLAREGEKTGNKDGASPSTEPEFLNPGRHQKRESWLSALIPRYTLQGMAIPLAFICTFGAAFFIPQDTSGWKSSALNNLIADFNDFFGLAKGEVYPYKSFDLGVSGYQPLGERLGGPVSPDNTSVLSVTTDAPFFLRGSVQDTYTGQGWRDAGYGGRFRWGSFLWRGQKKLLFDPTLPLGGREARALAGEMTRGVRLTVNHRTSKFYSLFAPMRVTRLSFTSSRRPEAYFNLQSELFLDGAVPYSASYSLTGSFYDRDLPGFDEKMLRLEELTARQRDPSFEDITRTCLTLPETVPQEVYDLTAEISQGLSSPYQKAVAIEQWLNQNCTYTLSPPFPAEDRDFTAQFLEAREGYCTYYATAMAVMARCAGLPSRYVNGYGLRPTGMAEPNYTATNATAHAWCEIYFSGIGWLAFDPVSWDVAVETQDALFAAQREESPRQTENTYVPQIPAEEDPAPLPPIREREIAETSRNTPTGALWIAAFVVLAVGVLLTVFVLYPYLCGRIGRLYSRQAVRRRFPRPGDAAEYYYRDILRQLALFDRAPGPGDTIRTFSRRADERVGTGSVTMEQIGEIMNALRFGGIAPSGDEAELLERYHERLEDMLREKLPQSRYFLSRVIPSFFTGRKDNPARKPREKGSTLPRL